MTKHNKQLADQAMKRYRKYLAEYTRLKKRGITISAYAADNGVSRQCMSLMLQKARGEL